jgi:hypothetical protein
VKTIAVAASVSALAGTIVPAGLFVAGRVDLDAVKLWMLVSTVVWFVATPVWLKQK